jgi:2-oxoglutarate dehydrogenase E1 component
LALAQHPLRNIFNYLEKCYASHIGIEFKYISDQKKIDWLTNEVEKKLPEPLPLEKKKRILEN